MILIYSENNSARLEYICKSIFKDFLQIDFQLTHNLDEFNSSDGVKINYSSLHLGNSVQIIPAGLIYEETVEEQNIEISNWKGIPCFYNNTNEIIPFDLFSACFYLISRYEEYLEFEGDDLTRFRAQDSLAFKNEFLEIPIIDHWMILFKEEIIKAYPKIHFVKNYFTFESTIDVDSALAYKSKGFYRILGGFGKDLIKFNFENFANRAKTLLRLMKDPYDTYQEFQDLHDKHQIKCTYFFLLADFGPNDVNLPHWSRGFKKLIQSVSNQNPVGIHPGYVSNYYPEKIEKETKRLQSITGKKITKSRQHFLMLKFPETYNLLIKNGIKEDFTLGYADRIGFRASTSMSFNFFDLHKNQERDLRLHPFVIMDVTLNLYMNLSPDEAIKKIKSIIEDLKIVKGHFIPVWHNESISEKWHWKGWSKVYSEMIEALSHLKTID